MMRRMIRMLPALLLGILVMGCEPADEPVELPTVETVEAAYGDAVEAEVSGNLVRLTVPMPEGFERGGTLWARSGPYFYLFTTATRDLMLTYPDLAGVEVVATTVNDREVARARLLRGALNDLTWPRAIAYASQAQTEGTESPRYLDRMVRHGEEVTEFEYNPEFVP